jgi:hypothetical protein
MQDAQYFRGQGAICLEIARQLSDRQAAANLRESAAHYFARATELEPARTPLQQTESGNKSAESRTAMRKHDLRACQEKRAYYRLLRHLLSDELQTYKEDQARPLPPRIADLLKTLLYPETQAPSSSDLTDTRDRRREA